MKNKLIGIIVLIIIATLLNGCTGQSTTTKNFQIGTKGLTIEKLSGTPSVIYENETFALGVFIKNLGAENVNQGKIMINFDDYFIEFNNRESGFEKSKKITLAGRNRDNPNGDSDYIEYVFNSKELGVIRESADTKINFNICYDYRTDLTTEICIDTKTRTADQRSYACKTKTFTSNSGQGAPIAITKIETEMLRLRSGENIKPVFRIYIKNMGKGYTLTPESTLCENPSIHADKINKLKIKAWISADIELECDPEIIRLVDGQAIARCEVRDQDLTNFKVKTTNYITLLRVLLEYNYVDSENFNLKIKRINEITIKRNVCGYYEIEQNGLCISLCEYCVNNPSSPECTRNINPENFKWTDASDFSCACSKETCLALNKEGKCVFGYCPGNSYCCSSDECRDKPDGYECGQNYVCINKKCSKTTECEYKYGLQNYSCNNIDTCINNTIKRGYCPGDETIVCCKTS
ncbi:MAG: hypothetical protein KatS3mg002_0579 [Candidatus Woesearchaeota archaeon]|nr:MAG: hypothetical protein KatS3mg002_0579 [Candidatus Woesearchaeota archaeon]